MSEQQWQEAYQQGVEDYRAGLPEDANRYGVGDRQRRCGWAAGWHDERRGMA